MPWADLLARVYKSDVLKCGRCGGRITMLAFTPRATWCSGSVGHLGLPSTGPPLAAPPLAEKVRQGG